MMKRMMTLTGNEMYTVSAFDNAAIVATLGLIALMFLRHLAVTRSQEGGDHDNTVRKAHQEERGITLSTRHTTDVIPCTPKLMVGLQASTWRIVGHPPYDWAKEEGESADPFPDRDCLTMPDGSCVAPRCRLHDVPPLSAHVARSLEQSWME